MRKPRNRQYLTNLATTMIQQLHVPNSMGHSPSGAQNIYEEFGDSIVAKLLVMTPETLGRIVDFGLPYNADVTKGKTALYLVHCGSYCSKYASGHDLLVKIACTAIVAKMYDIFSERMKVEYAQHAQDTLGPDHPVAMRLKAGLERVNR
ncbi:MAG: hypothetical protein A3B25_00430 [Candidatus Ryanbacteria bacterium RIFCSPLOWO2_01_FULL_48_26]|uniref:Uncharacterized protein n=1 Tax=Candidatus Ryanbacteria bacterium RIFCSPLOWO2_01_FULL_48_26 TaxID=1802126 RepID=A0A1G2GS61_9BACT|nr:MAG: hypothetical protein A3B25_00430 [Candidatus Ryanbacteria bacterium RIFCSPLOWO2_01_FULL_48_26]OHB21502.1 MAG: hypothetical protein A3J67_03080 [Parcubacteria group bacterium RIFCSPHIGHO2_02_FULL_48_10b]